MSVSGGGVLKSSKYPAEAQMLLAYITGKGGQQVLADSNALEYAICQQCAGSTRRFKPLSELDPALCGIFSQLNAPKE